MKRFDTIRDTDSVDNPNCKRCSNSESRQTDKDGLCTIIKSVVDGMPLRCVGKWANNKIYYLLQYFQIFAQGMHKKWGKLRYVEICSGPGRCSTRDGKEQDGTALSIVKNERFDLLADAIFIDYSPNVIGILKERFKAVGKLEHAHAIVGDYNDQSSIVNALQEFSPNSLTLCFIDPTDCSLPFEAIRSIVKATSGKCDFLISFFDELDFHRNAVNATLDDSFGKLREKYERFLGTSDFFSREEVIAAAKAGKHDVLSQMFRNQYCSALNGIGLSYQDWKQVKNYYKLLFVSQHPKGLEFWKKASKLDPEGQGQLFG
ncbi:MAG: three-Cys-motif partner protein TcmP [Planctomycetes bacterium]|nr:three-Cys-motif partner protein TcmP [Planctomycetota bacterium]